jgi:hypothetical protein
MSKEVAETILEQLGGRRFMAMTGARHFLADGSALRFRLPSNFAQHGINAITITLNAFDTYDLVFSKVHGPNFTSVATVRGIFADQLRDVFRSETGLDTTL